MTTTSRPAQIAVPAVTGRRRRNPRGQGHLLREELIQAALALLADAGDPGELSLRAVAARAGIAAPSIYRHFPDLAELKIAVVEHGFTALAATRATASRTSGAHADPVQVLLAGAGGYCQFGLDHPGLYQLMFGPDPGLPAALAYQSPHSPGRRAITALADAIRDCQHAGRARTSADPFQLAVTMWSLEHGQVTLRLSRPNFPWPPLDDTLALAVTALLELTATH